MRDNKWRLSFTYAGCFLGAGFVSGQELWQFFGRFGTNGAAGLILAVIILCFLGIAILYIAYTQKIFEMDKIVVRTEKNALRNTAAIIQCFFIFGILVVMIAGMGALINQLCGVSHVLSGIIMTAVVAFFAILGLNGLVTVFSVSVPVIVITTVFFAAAAISNGDLPSENSVLISKNAMLPNWYISAFLYAAYNMMAAIGIITPFAKKISSKRDIYCGICVGSVILLAVALSIIMSLLVHKSASLSQLPMLAVAEEINPFLSYIYGQLLLIGMFGTALSSIVALETYFTEKSEIVKKHRKIFIIFTAVSAFFGSLFGFGDLVGTVYPLFGYISIVFMIMISLHFFYLIIKK